MALDVDKTKVTVVEVKGHGPKVSFQSEDAEKIARVVPPQDDAPRSALVSAPEKRVAVPAVDMDEMVMVTPRQTITRTRIGASWYSFQANKKYMVPRHVSLVLEEKGVI